MISKTNIANSRWLLEKKPGANAQGFIDYLIARIRAILLTIYNNPFPTATTDLAHSLC